MSKHFKEGRNIINTNNVKISYTSTKNISKISEQVIKK